MHVGEVGSTVPSKHYVNNENNSCGIQRRICEIREYKFPDVGFGRSNRNKVEITNKI
jgi:hypothetical protein